MLNKAGVVPEEQHFILSTLSPGLAQKCLASAVLIAIVAVCALIMLGPLKNIQVGRIVAFVPIYATAMFLCDAITAILLYAQFSIVRSPATLVVASGYLFAALMLIPWILVFPGVFAPSGLMGGLQTTSWIYFYHHTVFSLFIIAYAFSPRQTEDKTYSDEQTAVKIVLSVAATAALVLAAACTFILAERLLPRVVLDSSHLSPLWPYVGTPVAFTSTLAIAVLWFRRRTALDLWLMVVMFLFSVEIPLSYFPDPERFSVGWYTVRVFGVLSSSIVLIVLLHEITTLYARLLRAVLARRREREARLMTGGAAAASIAHEFRQPLTAMITSANAGFRFLDRHTPNIDRAKEAFRRIAADGYRADTLVESIRSNFKNDDRTKASLNVNDLIHDTLVLEHNDLEKYQIILQAEPGAPLPHTSGNRIQLQQVLVNLIANAIDAMASREQPRILSVRSTVRDKDWLLVSVADTGAGIEAQDLDRIFNPLYTTKSDGMGMGLSICRAIVEAHNGRLWATPNSPRGAVFQFTLPADSSMPADA